MQSYLASENIVVCRGVDQIAMLCGYLPEGFINNSLEHNAILVRLFLQSRVILH